MANKKILITGSSGMIGTRLFEKLLAEGHQVIGFDKKPNAWQQNLNAMTIIGDLLIQKDVDNLPKDFDLVIHLAANARVYDLVLKPELALENITATYRVLDFMRNNNIKKIIFSSSREVYSNRKKVVAKETDVDLHKCESAYSASKISDEALVYSFSQCYGINYIVCRFSNVYGMYDDSDRFIPLMIKKLAKHEDALIYGKDKKLDFTYIDDAVLGLVKCVSTFSQVKNNVFNIAYGRGETLVDVMLLIKKAMASKSKIIVKKNRPGEVVKFVADIKKAKKMLGYRPQYSIENGLKKTIDWYANR